MCGITGFFGKGSIETLEKMNRALTHRGPDAEGYFVDGNIYLAQRRLSILDLEGGKQPMISFDKKEVIVFNGEIYNHSEIREELLKKGYKFNTHHSDTETILNAYKEWGYNCVEKFNGMWAFTIFDLEKKNLFCSRDRFGKKPFYYSLQNNSFYFSSELTSFKQIENFDLTISKKSLQKYFAYGYVPSPLSIYSKVFKLQAGHSLILNLKNLDIKINKYWSYKIEPFEKIPKNPEIEWGSELISLLEKSVKRRLMGDVPIGVFLSGGIDSSSIVALASKFFPKNNLKTFSIGFKETSFDESQYAKKIANLFQTDHHLEMLSMDKAIELIPEVLKKLDEPMGDSSIIPTYLLCKLTSSKVKVALSGDGGDELLAGYDPFKALRYAELYSKFIPKPIHESIKYLFSYIPVSHKNMSLDFKIKKTLNGLSYPQKYWLPIWMSSIDLKDLKELFSEDFELEDIYSESIQIWENTDSKNLIDKVSEFYINLYLQDGILVKADRASMMNSIEVRCPFLDIDLVNFIRKIPAIYKFKNGISKYILKKGLEEILPSEILYRSKKGFGMPIGDWFYNGKINIENNSSSYLNHSVVERKLNNHKNSKSDERLFLWNNLVYQYFNSSKEITQ